MSIDFNSYPPYVCNTINIKTKCMKKAFFFLTISLGFGLIVTSCKTEGCTEPNAINYDPTADKNDGSCHYENNNSSNNNSSNNNNQSCTNTYFFDNYDEYTYTIHVGSDSFTLDAWGDVTLDIYGSGCFDVDIYDGSYYEGSKTVCPCSDSNNKSIEVNYY